MANRYWVGGTGNWSDTAHWSTSSGGSSGASAPTSSDDVYIDANSGGGTVTAGGVAYAKNLDSTGFTGVLSASGGIFWVYGNVTFGTGHTLGSTSNIWMIRQGSANANINFNGRTLPANRFVFQGGGINTLTGVVNGSGIFQIDATTTLNLNNQTFNAGSLQVLPSSTVTLGSSVITLSSTSTAFSVNSGTLNANTSEIILTGNGATFTGGGATFNKVRMSNNVTVSGSNTISELTIDSARTVSFTEWTTQTITTLISGGTVSNKAVIKSRLNGSQYYFTKPSGTVNVENMSIRDSIATGGATWNAINSTNVSGNTGWNFFAITDKILSTQVTISKSILKSSTRYLQIQAIVTLTTDIKKKISKTIQAIQTTVATLDGKSVILIVMNVSTTIGTSLNKILKRTLQSIASIPGTITKQLDLKRTLQATTTIGSEITKLAEFLKNLSVSVTTTTTIVLASLISKTLAVTTTIESSISRILKKTLDTATAIVGSITKQMELFRTLQTTVAITTNLNKIMTYVRTLASEVTMSATMVAISFREILLSVTTTIASTIQFNYTRIVSLAVTVVINPTMSLLKELFRTLQASVEMTESLARILKKRLETAVTTTVEMFKFKKFFIIFSVTTTIDKSMTMFKDLKRMLAVTVTMGHRFKSFVTKIKYRIRNTNYGAKYDMQDSDYGVKYTERNSDYNKKY